MDKGNRTARIVGILFIVGTLSGILSVYFTKDILSSANYIIVLAENENQIITGAFLILFMGLSLSMVPVMLYPILRKQSEALALGAVVFRGVLETIIYIIIASKILFLLKISQGYVASGESPVYHLQALGLILRESDVVLEGILGIIFSIGALIIYYLFYRSRLIPQWLSLWGFLGGIIYLAASLAGMLGFELEILMLPLAVQEMFMALWLIIRGFDPTAFIHNAPARRLGPNSAYVRRRNRIPGGA